MSDWMRPSVLFALMAMAAAATAAPPPTVVFVCEHGSAKSLMAASLLSRMARERGVAVRVLSRGTTPDASVPAVVAESLRGDGFDVASFRPQRLTEADVDGSTRVVAMGADLGSLGVKAGDRLVRWDGVPSVATSYADARKDVTARIDKLLDELQASPAPR
jgi:arsenate reductase